MMFFIFAFPSLCLALVAMGGDQSTTLHRAAICRLGRDRYSHVEAGSWFVLNGLTAMPIPISTGAGPETAEEKLLVQATQEPVGTRSWRTAPSQEPVGQAFADLSATALFAAFGSPRTGRRRRPWKVAKAGWARRGPPLPSVAISSILKSSGARKSSLPATG